MQIIYELVAGIGHYREEKRAVLLDSLLELEAYGQKPKILFISCSDSRYSPEVITNAKPGTLFVHRNIGAIVPPFSSFSRSVTFDAVIEFAVDFLNVEHIIVCGHTSCGAAQALMNLDNLGSQSRLKEWLTYVEQVPGYVRAIESENASKIQNLAELALVKASLMNLMTYACVNKRVRENKLSVIGWRYNLIDMNIEAYDSRTDTFISETEYLESLK